MANNSANENEKKNIVQNEDGSNASIVMRGVSGKKITADVKVVKVKKKVAAKTDEKSVETTSKLSLSDSKNHESASTNNLDTTNKEFKENSATKDATVKKSANTILTQDIDRSKSGFVTNKHLEKTHDSNSDKISEKYHETKAAEKISDKSGAKFIDKRGDKTEVKNSENRNAKLNSGVNVSINANIHLNKNTHEKSDKSLVDKTMAAVDATVDKIKQTGIKVIDEAGMKSKTEQGAERNVTETKVIKAENSAFAATIARMKDQAAKKEAQKQNKKNNSQSSLQEHDFTKNNKKRGNFNQNVAKKPPFAAKLNNDFTKDKDEDETHRVSKSRHQSPKKNDFEADLLSTQKESRLNRFNNSAKSSSYKDKELNKSTHAAKDSVKDISRSVKRKAMEFAKGAGNEDDVLDTVYRAKHIKKNRANKNMPLERNQSVRKVLKNISLPETITVKELAEAIEKTSSDLIMRLMKLGLMATLNQEIDFDTAAILCEEMGITAEKLVEITEEDILFDDSDDLSENLEIRPPVVCVMGHVDHGKTSLLDRIRETSVVAGEAGGITQHIGAYMVEVNGRKITFLDTPGHEAFTTMRARGAKTTDIAILVVAADDGVMPQTIESINHAKAANTQIVVAINKIDRPGANIEKVKQELANHDIVCEEWGGGITMVPVSAKTGEGIDELLEMLLLTADVMELKADPNRQAKGTVIEAKLDKQKGAVATLLVQRGTLNEGDCIVTGHIVGRIRAMTDFAGNSQNQAGPSMPVEILGLPEAPLAGDIFYAVADEKVARQLAEKRRIKEREESIGKSSKMSLESLYAQMAQGDVKDLNIIVKADTVGSVEAVKSSLERLSNDEVRIKAVHGAVGAITESDIRLAEVANAIVIGFNVRPANNVNELAAAAGVDMRLYRVIYSAIEDIEAAMKGMLAPEFKEVELGKVEIRQVFRASNIGTIGGSYVLFGKIVRNCSVRLVRNGIVVMEGKLASLKRFKDDVKEVAAGYECGLALENYNDIKEGDIVECYTMEEIKRD